MTADERRQASKARMAAAGEVEFTIRASGKTLAIINAMADGTNEPRAVIVRGLLDYAVAKLDVAAQAGNKMMAAGATDEAVELRLRELLHRPHNPKE